MQQILLSKSNKDYKETLLSGTIISDLINFVKDNGDADIDAIKKFYTDNVFEKYTADGIPQQIELFLLVLWALFLKENMAGQSVYTMYVEETKAPIDQTELPKLEFDPICYTNETLQNQLIDYFAKDSEIIYERTQFLILFLGIQMLTQKIQENIEAYDNGNLWMARYSYHYNELLTSSVAHLQDNSLDCYAK